MIKRFLFLSIVCQIFYANSLFASVYDDDVLEIFSKIMPRFVLMSSQKKNIQNQMEVCILYDKLDERSAVSLIEKIQNSYPNGIKNYPIKLIKSDYGSIDKCRKSQLAFMFDSDDSTINNSIRFLNSYSILTVAYDAKYLGKGVDATLFLGRKVMPYININALQHSGIELDNTLVQISKIYMKGDDK
ncbi:MAG: hypothetical protein JZU62_01150 [Sulfuricurvum sp.]|uniref:hypothetical protein n=1 Tax=Sulfuricurvum sp. TaxID=2025608 RepID=UPI0025FA87AA|nr:hypothetical protein [Sulfuricurvum sp.]MBV5320266.1 hypothetical protein [Sulfuricurvum sp.]